MGGGGTPELQITLISPESPVLNYAGESRTFKASVNQDNVIVRWKLDGYLVQGNNNPPANSEISCTDDAVFGSHELKVEAEKNGVLVSKSWTWNVNEILGTCYSVVDGNSLKENAQIEIDEATLYRRFDGTHYVEVNWSGITGMGYIADPKTIVSSCEMSVKIMVSWQVLSYPGDPEPQYVETTIDVNYCNSEGTNILDLPHPYDNITVVVYLNTKCTMWKWLFDRIPIKLTLSDHAYASCRINAG
jgi:hypothetical protein